MIKNNIMNTENIFDQKAATWDDNPRRIKMVNKVVSLLNNHINVSNDSKILDYGCGTGLLGMQFINDAKEITFCDSSKGMLEQVAKKLDYYQYKNGNLLHADFNDLDEIQVNTDFVLSMLVLHHVPEISQLIGKFNKSLQAGGKFIWIDLDKEDGSFHEDDNIPHLGFSKDEIDRYLTENGFKLKLYDLDTLQIKKETSNGVLSFKAFVVIADKI